MKKNGMFTGWTNVFRFTLSEVAGKKGFMVSTLAIGIGLFLLIVGIFAMISLGQVEEERKPIAVKSIYVVNDSQIEYLEFQAIDGVTFYKSEESLEAVQEKINHSKEEALLHIEKGQGQNIKVNLILPSESNVSESEGEEFLVKITDYIRELKLKNLGIEQSKLMILLSPVTTSYSVQGNEPESVGETVVKLVVPMLSVMILYFMVLFYGQSVGKIVSSEKTSKIIDTLLLSVKPYALILGKVTAMAAAGILQFSIWILAVITGILTGNAVGYMCNEKFSNPLYAALDIIRETGTGAAFTVPSVILGVFVLFLGFTFYLVVAGLVASKISKAEDLAQGMGMYQFIVIAGFLFSYLPLASSSESFVQIERLIPFTAAFLLPGEVMLGTFGLGTGIGLIILLAIFTFLAVILTARFYRNQIFYVGK